ncbi:MAG: methyltransferase domain-containing protein [Crenarchaeota archaeon]|nr:methyltransferase domain-containing protein [Thermoproteota archaeon]
MKKLPVGFVKLKIRFLNFLDFLVYKEDFEQRKLKQLKQDSRKYEEWMRNDWELQAKKDPFYFIRTVKNQSEEEFWKSGYTDRNAILESKSIKERIGKKFDNLKALEIGCGIGRILIPMSEKFQESIGVDISQKMVNIGKQKTKNYTNCKIY